MRETGIGEGIKELYSLDIYYILITESCTLHKSGISFWSSQILQMMNLGERIKEANEPEGLALCSMRDSLFPETWKREEKRGYEWRLGEAEAKLIHIDDLNFHYEISDLEYSVQFIHSVVSNSLRPHEPQHARPPCPSPTPIVHPNPWVGDAIQPSYPLSSPTPPAPNPSQHQGLCKWVSSSHLVAKVLEFQLQNQSYPWTHRTDLL